MKNEITENSNGTFTWSNITLDQLYALSRALDFQENENYYFNDDSDLCLSIINMAIDEYGDR